MHNPHTVPIERVYNLLDSLCDDLDFLADPDIEKKMICDLSCCISNGIIANFFEMDQNNKEKMPLIEQIIGADNLAMLRIFEEPFYQATDYDEKEGFSQEQRWKDFAQLAQDLSNRIKKSVEEHKLTHKKESISHV